MLELPRRVFVRIEKDLGLSSTLMSHRHSINIVGNDEPEIMIR